jgi:hypothetical protein
VGELALARDENPLDLAQLFDRSAYARRALAT